MRPGRLRGAAAALAATAVLAACSSGGSGGGGGAAPGAPPSRTGTAAPSPSPTPSRDPAEVAADAALAALDDRSRAAQLVVAGVRLDDLAAADAVLATTGVGGLFLAGRSSAPVADLAAATGSWQASRTGPRLWVAADQEGGAVQSLSGEGFADLPSARTQARSSPDDVRAQAAATGAALAAAGVNLDLAPVADAVPAGTERGNAPIGRFGRQYGATPEAVEPYAAAVVAGLGSAGVTAAVKHYPGLGRVSGNTDTAAGVTDTTTGPDDPQVALFGRLAHLPERPFVMVSTATYAALDAGAPAAFSPAVVDGLLRGRLGVDGVVVSDDLGRAASVADVAPGERAVRFVAAGGTLVLTVDAALVPAMVDALLARAAADPAFAARLRAAERTALLAKARAGLLPAAPPAPPSPAAPGTS